MRNLKTALFAMIVASLLLAHSAMADEDKSLGLFVNLTTFQTGQAGHALSFAGTMHKRGHPVTLFLNHKAVLYASKSAPQSTFPMTGQTPRDMLTELMANGVTVIVCRMCSKMNGVVASDLIDGANMGNPDLVAASLFDPKFRVISW